MGVIEYEIGIKVKKEVIAGIMADQKWEVYSQLTCTPCATTTGMPPPRVLTISHTPNVL